MTDEVIYSICDCNDNNNINIKLGKLRELLN